MLDAKRGKIFTRLIKEISIAAKNGGGDPDSNPRLRGAILAAKSENMPQDNIKRAIQRGTGELPGTTYEEFSLEGYGPGGVAILLDINTDNRNRTVSEIRHMFSKNGGNLGEQGSVAWMFERKSQILIPTQFPVIRSQCRGGIYFGACSAREIEKRRAVIISSCPLQRMTNGRADR